MSFIDDIKAKVTEWLSGIQPPEFSMETLEKYIEFPKIPEIPAPDFPQINSVEDLEKIDFDSLANVGDFEVGSIKIKPLAKIELPVVGNLSDVVIGGYEGVAEKLAPDYPVLSKIIHLYGTFRYSKIRGGNEMLKAVGIDTTPAIDRIKEKAASRGIKIPSLDFDKIMEERMKTINIDSPFENMSEEEFIALSKDPEALQKKMMGQIGLGGIDMEHPEKSMSEFMKMLGLGNEFVDKIDLSDPSSIDLKSIASTALDQSPFASNAFFNKIRGKLNI